MTQTSKQEQKRIIKQLENESSTEVGDTCYLIDIKWWRKWTKYVGYDFGSGQDGEEPGPIANEPLVENGKLKRHLSEYYNYHIVCEAAWHQLVEWYGGGPEIPRKVIKEGFAEKRVEVYLLPLKLLTLHPNTNKPDTTNIKTIEISKTKSVSELKKLALSKFDIELQSGQDARLHIFYGPTSTKHIAKESTTLEDALLVPGTRVLLEVQSASGEWHLSTKSQLSNDFTSSYRSGYWDRPTQRGLCGLSNLGNTCFMNSSLQCLSNTKPLTEYFLSGKYHDEINRVNPLGMKGQLAEQYGTLINQIWSGKHSSISPSKFKWSIGKFAPQFAGYAQHDSQELLAFLLDGLHEDLNRVLDKPYVEMKESDGRDDHLVAKESWERHLIRNKSIIVDLFQGQLKSTVECPHCDKVSVTFDPFMYLSLPLPSTKLTEIMLTFFPANGKRPTKYSVKVKKAGTVSDIKTKLASVLDLSSSELILALRRGHFFERFPADNLPVKQLESAGQIMVYQVPSYEQHEDFVQTSFIHRTKTVSKYLHREEYNALVIPFATRVPADISGKQLYECAWKMVERFTKKQSGANGTAAADGSGAVGDMDVEQEEEEEETTAAAVTLPETIPFTLYHTKDPLSLGVKIENNNESLNLTEYDTIIAIEWGQEQSVDNKEACLQNVDPQANKSNRERDATTVKECISLFTEREQLGVNNTWYCPQCKDHVQAFKHFALWKLPDTLVIHLKRFQYSRYSRRKLSTFVDFPIEGLALNCFEEEDPVIYDLYAVSNHSGGLGGGHYTAYVKNADDGRWYLYNDSSVSSASEENIRSTSAYVLFYQRRYPRNISADSEEPMDESTN